MEVVVVEEVEDFVMISLLLLLYHCYYSAGEYIPTVEYIPSILPHPVES